MAHHAAESARTTQGTAECLDAAASSPWCWRAFEGQTKEDVLFAEAASTGAPTIQAIARGYYRHESRDAVRGTGHVDACLEAALWCVWTTGTFEAAVLEAANLGDDADTTAAVAGQVAGARTGSTASPSGGATRCRFAIFSSTSPIA